MEATLKGLEAKFIYSPRPPNTVCSSSHDLGLRSTSRQGTSWSMEEVPELPTIRAPPHSLASWSPSRRSETSSPS